MKYKLQLLIMLVLSIYLPMMTACSSDDDDDDKKETIIDGDKESPIGGKVTIQYGDVTSIIYNAYEPTFSLFSQEIVGTSHYDLSSGATFAVDLGEMNDITSSSYWQFQTHDKITQGTALSVNGIFFGSNSYNYDDNPSGSVLVKAVGDDTITLQFNNFQFKRYYTNSNGQQTLTVNGNITFKYKPTE